MGKATTIRISPAMQEKLNYLLSHYSGNRTAVLEVAIDRLYQAERVDEAQLRAMAESALDNWDLDEETDPTGAIRAGLEYLALPGGMGQDVIDSHLKGREDWDGLEEWGKHLGTK